MKNHLSITLCFYFIISTNFSDAKVSRLAEQIPQDQFWFDRLYKEIQDSKEDLKSEREGLKSDIDEKIESIEARLLIQKENLEYRNTCTEWWLGVLGILLTFFGIGTPILAIIYSQKLTKDINAQTDKANKVISQFIKDSKERIRLLETQASMHIDKIRQHEQTSQEYSQQIKRLSRNVNKRDLSKEQNKDLVSDAQEIKNDSNASPIDRDWAGVLDLYYSEDYPKAINGFIDFLKKYENEINIERLGVIWFGIAYSYSKLKDDENAIKYYNLSLSLEPDNPDILNNLGNCYFRKGMFKESLINLQKAVSIKSDEAFRWSNLGSTQTKLEQHKDAIDSYEKVLELDDTEQKYVNDIYPNYVESLIIQNQLSKGKKHIHELNKRNIIPFVAKLFQLLIMILENQDIQQNLKEFETLKIQDLFHNFEEEQWNFQDLENWIKSNDSSHLSLSKKEKITDLINFLKNWIDKNR